MVNSVAWLGNNISRNNIILKRRLLRIFLRSSNHKIHRKLRLQICVSVS